MGCSTFILKSLEYQEANPGDFASCDKITGSLSWTVRQTPDASCSSPAVLSCKETPSQIDFSLSNLLWISVLVKWRWKMRTHSSSAVYLDIAEHCPFLKGSFWGTLDFHTSISLTDMRKWRVTGMNDFEDLSCSLQMMWAFFVSLSVGVFIWQPCFGSQYLHVWQETSSSEVGSQQHARAAHQRPSLEVRSYLAFLALYCFYAANP